MLNRLRCLVFAPLGVLALLIPAGISGAQNGDKSYSEAEILDLATGGVPFSRILTLAKSKCIDFRITPRVEQGFAFGHYTELLEGLRSVCYKSTAPARSSVAKNSGRRVDGRQPTVVSRADTAHHAYFEFQVDKPVTLAEGNVAAVYPEVLRAAGVEGEVYAQFVVTENGRADLQTLRVLRSTNDLFLASVRQALTSMRYHPAEIGGKAVRQLVQQPFDFKLAR